jgi:hypothetical protein
MIKPCDSSKTNRYFKLLHYGLVSHAAIHQQTGYVVAIQTWVGGSQVDDLWVTGL